jgi:hypothetical protein
MTTATCPHLEHPPRPEGATRESPPNVWVLRIVLVLFVLGTAKFVQRDPFHGDDTIVQPAIEVSSVTLGTCLTIAAAIRRRTKVVLKLPAVLLLTTIGLAVAFSPRSWDPWLSATRGALTLMIVASLLLLVQTYGFEKLARCAIGAYFLMTMIGVAVVIALPEDYPLIVYEPGEETLRSRLHLLRIHPITLADDYAICLLLSVLFRGGAIRIFRVIAIAGLLMTVSRSSIAMAIPLYIAAELLFANLRAGLRRGAVVTTTLVLLPAAVGVVLMFAFSDWAFIDQIRTGVERIVDVTSDDATLNGRTDLWRAVIRDLSPVNIFGYGMDGDRYYVRTISLWAEHSHNSVLESILSAGYLGALSIVAALTIVTIRLSKEWQSPSSRVLSVTLLYVIAVGMMNTSWFDASSLIVICAACGARSTKAARAPKTRLGLAA